MKFIKLGEVIYGAKTDRCGDKNFPVLSITKSDGIVLQSEKFKKRIASNDTQQYKVVKKGQLVQGIHIDEANFGIQTIVDAGIVSPAYKIWNVDESKIIPKYLEIILRSPKSIRYYSSNFNGSVKRRERLSDKDFLAMDIPCPSLLEQQKAINLIVQLKEIINLREQELQKLDDLVKARFVEMFGDPILNPMGWSKEKTENHIDLLSGFPFQSEQYVDSGVNICGGLIIMPQRIQWEECKHWPSVKGFEEYLLEEGDIVMALDRPWISEGFKIAQIDIEHLPALLIQRTARIRGIDIVQEYLYYCFICGGFDKHSNVTGSLVPHISAKDIRSFEIMLPPIDLQNQFAAFVRQVDKSKSATFLSLLYYYVLHPYIGFTNNFRRKQS